MPDPPRAFPWRVAFAHCTDALFVAGRSRRVRYANPAFERLTGKSPAAWRGMRLSRLLSASDLGRTLAVPPEVWAGEVTTALRPPPDDPTGVPCWQLHFLPIRAADGVNLVLGSIRVLDPDPAAPNFAADTALASLRERHAADYAWGDWDAPSPLARKLLARARFVAESRVSVWLTGPSGVGKQRLARTLHAHGPDRHSAFVRIDGAAVQPYLVDVQLFGKGSLAASGRVGTLYLADPASLSGELRGKLLAWLTSPNAPRLITGSDRTAAELVSARQIEPAFEAELSVLELTIPPLAARPVDLSHYCAIWARRAGRPVPQAQAIAALARHDWSGNVRELFATLAGAAGDGPIGVDDLPRFVRDRRLVARTGPPDIPLVKLLAAVEKRAIERALTDGGHAAAAARRLGLTREALRRRAAALGVPLPAKGDS